MRPRSQARPRQFTRLPGSGEGVRGRRMAQKPFGSARLEKAVAVDRGAKAQLTTEFELRLLRGGYIVGPGPDGFLQVTAFMCGPNACRTGLPACPTNVWSASSKASGSGPGG